MKKSIATWILTLVWNAAVFAAAARYPMRVDGLACLFCDRLQE